MVFDSVPFGIFLVALLLVVRLPWEKPGQAVPALLLLASAVFYAFAGVLAWLLFAFSILANYLMASRLQASEGAVRRRWLIAALIFNLFYLFCFKYAGLFGAGLSGLGLRLGWWARPLPAVVVLLPIGISFYTFEAMSLLVDIHRGRYRVPRLRTYALFLGYFPHLVAGPILRGKDLLPQLEPQEGRRWDPDWSRAVAFLSMGLFKKAVLADSYCLLVDPVFLKPGAYAAPKLWIGAYAFALRIFFDFSGYSDMAEGASALFGVRLTRNFIRPFGAASLSEYWRRWHVSLSTWLRDYLYFSLGGSRQGQGRTLMALFATMALGGLWHGARWTFLVWGCFHGLLLGLERVLGLARPAAEGWKRWTGVVVTFHLVLVGWVLFRADTLAAALLYLKDAVLGAWVFDANTLGLAALLVLGMAFAVWEGSWSDRAWDLDRPGLSAAQLALLHAAIVMFRMGQTVAAQTFIYFRF